MIKAENLIKNYGDFSLNISLDIPEGCITGLIGKNGAGKSTTIKSILGLVLPDGGSIQVLGKEAGKLTPEDRQHMGVALSDSGFSNYLTVKDVAKILEKMYRDFDREAFLKRCSDQRLPLQKQLRQFSTGMKAKLRVLVALSHRAKLLIMDEPTSGLDVEARNEILDILRDYLAEDETRSILITSHIATDLEGLCDDIYLIHDGRILIHEETDVILSDYAVLKLSERDLEKLDQQYILRTKKEGFGMVALTDQKQFYKENYPELVIENCGIDDLILMMTGGERK
ncbi:MAG: ABC transporter ATP-binding protein [Lachnospiraceae bacterium]|nr:ABC transporter ATP-binding protein [Lachnospiraceae bacterium]